MDNFLERILLKAKILNLLSEDEYISGESISTSLGITRAAV